MHDDFDSYLDNIASVFDDCLTDEDIPVGGRRRNKSYDGEYCMKCTEYFPFAEPNRPDDKFICYGCRSGW